MEKHSSAHGDFSEAVIGACIEVHRYLGPGLLESAYEECLARELEIRGILYERQVVVPISYKGTQIDAAYRLDLVVGNTLVVEVKAVESMLPVHRAQVLTYLRLTGHPVALVVNFNVPLIKEGLRRLYLPTSKSPFL